VKKRLFLLFSLAAVFVVAGVVFLWRISGNTYYHGRPVKEWSKRAYANDPQGKTALKALGSNAVPALIELLQTKDSPLRKRAWSYFPSLPKKWQAQVWQKVGPPLAVNTRQAAAASLGIIGPDAKAAIPALTEAMQDREGTVRWDAASALGRIGKDSVPPLISALHDPEIPVRHAAAATLGQVGPSAELAVPALLQTLGDTNETIRNSTADSLWRLGGAGQLALIDASVHATGLAREAAARRLEWLNASGMGAVSAMVNLSRDGNPQLRRRAIESLGLLGAGNPLARKAYVSALNDPVSDVRLAAIHVLAERGTRAQFALAELTRLRNEDDARIRAAAETALAKISVPTNASEGSAFVAPKAID
jgi:HEAT repeat protein